MLCTGESTGGLVLGGTGGTPGYMFSIDGGTSFGPSASFSNLPANSYALSIKDSQGCTTQNTATISGPANPLGLQVTAQVNASCGESNGAIEVNGEGGTSPYVYTIDGGNTFSTTGIFADLAAGSYTVEVRDANECTSSLLVSVSDATGPSLTIANQVNLDCQGDQDGSVLLSATGGSSPYTYRINNGDFGASNSFTGLGAGTYSFEVKDNLGCIASTQVSLIEPAELIVAISAQTDVLCAGQPSGSISLEGTGGTLPYSFSKDGGNTFVSTNIFSNLSAGNYALAIRDQNACVAEITTTVLGPSNPLGLVLINKTDASCGEENGSINVNAQGGTAPYIYSIDGGNTFSTTGIFNTLPAGGYTIEVRDDNNCTATIQVSLNDATGPTLSIVEQINLQCKGDENGSVQMAATGGLPPYMYRVNGTNFSTTPIISGLAAGSYILEVKDQLGCIGSEQVTLTEPTEEVLLTLISQQDVLCKGEATGSLNLLGTGGTAPYTYSLNGGATFSTATNYPNLVANTYALVIKDANNCTNNLTATISGPSTGLSLQIDQQEDETCGLGNGRIKASAQGGAPSYLFSIDGGISFSTTGDFQNLTGNIYTVEVRDQNDCKTTLNTTLLNSPSPTLEIGNQQDILCKGDLMGSVLLIAGEGTPPFMYSQNDGPFQLGNIFENLVAGEYTFTVKDANTCTSNIQITIAEPTLDLSLTLISKTDVQCSGDSSGTILVNGVGGTPAYSYSIDGGITFTNSGTFNNLPEGIYSLLVRDANNCTQESTIEINGPANALTLSLGNKIDANCGESNGSISVVAQGGTPTYLYSIDNGLSFTSVSLFENLAAGSYTLQVKDDNACTSNLVVNLNNSQSPTLSIATQVNVDCKEGQNGSIKLRATGGIAPYTFRMGDAPFQNDSVFTSLAAGLYSFEVKDANGCIAVINGQITEPLIGLGIDILSTQDMLCQGDTTGSISLQGIGGNAPYTYSIDGGAGFFPTGTFNLLPAGSYSVVIKDEKQCTAETSIELAGPSQALVLALDTTIDETCGKSNGSISVNATGGTPLYLYSVDGGISYSTLGLFDRLSGGEYVLWVRDRNNCIDSLRASITEESGPVVFPTSTQNVSCEGGNDGEVTLQANDGKAPYTFKLESGLAVPDSTFTGLEAGVYTFLVEDANGCTNSTIAQIVEPETGPSLALVDKQDTGCENNTGSFTVQVNNGVSPFLFSIDGGNTSQPTGFFGGLGQGAYNIMVQDDNGCRATIEVILGSDCCPIFSDASLSKFDICSEDTVSLRSSVVGADGGLLSWNQLFLDGTPSLPILSPDSLSFVSDSCGVKVYLFQASYEPVAQECPLAQSDTVVLAVYPKIEAQLIEKNTCEAVIENACQGFLVSWTDNLGNSGEGLRYLAAVEDTGTVTFTVSNPAAPPEIACSQKTFTWQFDCNDAPCAIIDILPGDQSPCNGANNLYSQLLTVTHRFAPDSGTLLINGQSFPIENSPQIVTLTGLLADGNPVDISASFSALPDCQFQMGRAFMAADPCGPFSCELLPFELGKFTFTLNDLPGVGDPRHVFQEDGLIEIFPDSTAKITGTLVNIANDSITWYVELGLVFPHTWTQWQNKGRNYRATPATADVPAADSTHTQWRYWVLDSANSFIIGISRPVDGVRLDLVHSPTDLSLGFQYGLAANDHNASLGLSGSFGWTSSLKGDGFTGTGGINASLDCGTSQDLIPLSLWQEVLVNTTNILAPIISDFAVEEGNPIRLGFQLLDREDEVSFTLEGLPSSVQLSVDSSGSKKSLVLNWLTMPGDKGEYNAKLITKDVAGQQRVREFRIQVAGEGQLPAALLVFNALKVGDRDVDVVWETGAELIGTLFEVERSTDGESFEKIGEVSGKGNLSEGYADYVFPDKEVAEDVVYYRLKQLAPDGTFVYSDTVLISFLEVIEPSITVFPSPVKDLLQVRIPVNVEGIYEINILDDRGRRILHEIIRLAPGVFGTSYDFSKYRNALYTIYVYGPGINSSFRFVKMD